MQQLCFNPNLSTAILKLVILKNNLLLHRYLYIPYVKYKKRRNQLTVVGGRQSAPNPYLPNIAPNFVVPFVI